MLPILLIVFLHCMLFIGNDVRAGTLTPEGKWKTISDKTGKATSIVRIWKEKDKLFGKVEVVIPQEGKDPNPLCHKCTGERKDLPITGMKILWDLTQNEDGWEGGYILDPNDGKTYSCLIHVVDDGNKLEVRGYVGFSLLGRTQYWQRVETP
ncbi:MAG: DUF2147 domain-containing protein [Nitrospirota bacterium]|nr:MAG: DUF2147 domain-containing protein [Nitrospirota bacterium]